MSTDRVNADVAILVPVLGRPHRVAPLLESALGTAPAARVLFLPDPGDEAERAAIRAAGADELPFTGNYAAKIQAGVRATRAPLVFLGADDLDFQPGWLETARAAMVGGIQVVGVNDLIDRRPARACHATHFLLTREYAERPTIDGGPGPLFCGYDHSWVDDEFIATATKRGVYAYAPDAHVAHRHPMNGTAEDDATYRRGRVRFQQDRRLFLRRSKLWR